MYSTEGCHSWEFKHEWIISTPKTFKYHYYVVEMTQYRLISSFFDYSFVQLLVAHHMVMHLLYVLLLNRLFRNKPKIRMALLPFLLLRLLGVIRPVQWLGIVLHSASLPLSKEVITCSFLTGQGVDLFNIAEVVVLLLLLRTVFISRWVFMRKHCR